jgi:tetratricopeptide (TPR) repeat protein
MLKMQYCCAALIAGSIGFAEIAYTQTFGSGSYGPAGGRYTVPGADYNQRIPTPRDGAGQQSSKVDALYEKASDATWNKNHAAAFQIYNKIISLDPRSAQAYFNRGSIKQEKMGDRAGALSDFRMAAKLFKQEGNSYMIRASSEHIEQLTR